MAWTPLCHKNMAEGKPAKAMNQARHADCSQRYQEHPIDSVPGATEERDTCILMGSEAPEKGLDMTLCFSLHHSVLRP